MYYTITKSGIIVLESTVKRDDLQAKILAVEDFAIKAHSLCDFDGLGYEKHLNLVVLETLRYINKLDLQAELYDELIIDLVCAAYLHDVIEDSHYNYNDIKKRFGTFVADIVFGCTTSVGRNREERFDDAFFARVRRFAYAFFIKCCDRKANKDYSKASGSRMFQVYLDEEENFLAKGTPAVYSSDIEQQLTELVINDIKAIT